MAGIELGDILREGDPARALSIYDLTRSRLSEIKNNTRARRDEVSVLAGSSYALRRLRRVPEAKVKIDESFVILRDLKDYPASGIGIGDAADAAMRALGDHYADTGRIPEAIATYEELLEKVRASDPQPETDLRHATGLSRIYRDLGNLYRLAGRAPQAESLDQQDHSIWQHWNERVPTNTFVHHQLASARTSR
jgi:tetratricopeptide (TPR) repeat protein